jgi:hypothetical protein
MKQRRTLRLSRCDPHRPSSNEVHSRASISTLRGRRVWVTTSRSWPVSDCALAQLTSTKQLFLRIRHDGKTAKAVWATLARSGSCRQFSLLSLSGPLLIGHDRAFLPTLEPAKRAGLVSAPGVEPGTYCFSTNNHINGFNDFSSI